MIVALQRCLPKLSCFGFKPKPDRSLDASTVGQGVVPDQPTLVMSCRKPVENQLFRSAGLPDTQRQKYAERYATQVKNNAVTEADLCKNLPFLTSKSSRRRLLKGIIRNQWAPATIQKVGEIALSQTDNSRFWNDIIRILEKSESVGCYPELLPVDTEKTSLNLTSVACLLSIQKVLNDNIQIDLALTIAGNKWGTKPETLIHLANTIPVFSITNSRQIVASAISEGVFGSDRSVLIALIANLSFFTDSESQEILASSIEKGCWTQDPVVLSKLTRKLSVFKDSKAQQVVARSVFERRWGCDSGVLSKLIVRLRQFSDPNAQRIIALAALPHRAGVTIAELTSVMRKWPLHEPTPGARYFWFVDQLCKIRPGALSRRPNNNYGPLGNFLHFDFNGYQFKNQLFSDEFARTIFSAAMYLNQWINDGMSRPLSNSANPLILTGSDRVIRTPSSVKKKSRVRVSMLSPMTRSMARCGAGDGGDGLDQYGDNDVYYSANEGECMVNDTG